MDTPQQEEKGILTKLSKVLHLHQLPKQENQTQISTPMQSKKIVIEKNQPISEQIKIQPKTTASFFPKPSLSQQPKSEIKISQFKEEKKSFQSGQEDDVITTDYDRILLLVKERKKIKLDEIARLLFMAEEKTAQEIQTLEDNGLIEVMYPAFGEPLICIKEKEES